MKGEWIEWIRVLQRPRAEVRYSAFIKRKEGYITAKFTGKQVAELKAFLNDPNVEKQKRKEKEKDPNSGTLKTGHNSLDIELLSSRIQCNERLEQLPTRPCFKLKPP